MTTSATAPPPSPPPAACYPGPWSAAACSATAISNSFASPMPSGAKSRPIGRSVSSSTIMPPTSIPKACPREGGGTGLAGTSSALDVPLHPDLGLLAQRRRELLLKDDAATHPPRRFPLDRRPADRHRCLSRRAQCQPQTLRLDQIRRGPFWPNSTAALYHQFDSGALACRL